MLVVEDDAVMCNFVENSLRRLGLHVIETCIDGSSALNRLQIFKPDVVLADIHMEPMGGLELVREMRRHPNPTVRDTKVIFMSSDARISTIQEALLLGIYGYIIKPPAQDTLRAKLEMTLHRSILQSDWQNILANTPAAPVSIAPEAIN